MKNLEFMECGSCRTESGTPILCESCIHNRDVIEYLKNELNGLQSGKFIVQYQYLQEDKWYDDPYFGHCDDLKPLTFKLTILPEVQDAVRRGVRYRIIQRKVSDIEVWYGKNK